MPAVAAVALVAAACGSSSSKSATTNSSASADTASGPAATSTPAAATGGASTGLQLNAAFEVATTSKPFDTTVSALKSAVSSNGMMVLGTLNQAGALSVTGLHLPGAETFFVGNPTVGKSLFSKDPAIGAAVPVRMYVWASSNGQTRVSYLDPASLAAAINPAFATPTKMLSAKAASIAQAATGSAPSATASVPVTFTTVASSKSFSSTVSGLKSAVSSAGMMVLGTLNQAGALSVTGLHLNGAESFFVGNPTTGKKLFGMDPAIGIEIPVDMYVWTSSSGHTSIGYFQPSAVFSAVNSQFAPAGQMFDTTAANIAKSAA
ncbi:MAG: DUF302 domain-containing protein [Acidobacteriota bacterium]|nr:DUF302 domain-containing protein [Acidobacteriota bacterium]